MSNKQETISDIVADIRAQNQGLPEDSYALSPLVCDLLSLADRIEAAAKREREAGAEAAQVCGEIGEMIGREATREKESRVGNAAAIRSALDKLVDFLRWTYAQDYPVSRDKLADAIDIGVSAIASSPRNCDVGTAEEQLKRFIAFCLSRKCNECPFVSSTYGECGVRWSQMPYEGGEK